MTLWMLAGLAVLAGYLSTLGEDAVRAAEQDRQRLQDRIDRLNTETTLTYLLATNPLSSGGLTLGLEPSRNPEYFESIDVIDAATRQILIGGAPYAGLGRVRFSLVDEASLISVNTPRYWVFRRVVAQLGIDDATAIRLINRITDYVDDDPLVLMEGAEEFAYRQVGAMPPPNEPMRSIEEVRMVLGFNEIIDDQKWLRLRESLTIRPGELLNFNLMPQSVLQHLLDASESRLDNFLLAREQGGVQGFDQLEALLGSALPEEIEDIDLRSRPTMAVRIVTWLPGDGQRMLTGIEFTPYGDSAPWRTDYRYLEPPSTRNHDAATPRSAPTPLLLPADPPADP